MVFCSIDCFTLGFWVESLIEIKDFHYQPNNHTLSLPSHNQSLGLTPVQWVRRDHHACLSLQKEKHWISLWFSLKSKGENLGRESIRRKEKKERETEKERWRNIILKSMCKSLAVQLPLALKGFAQLKPHASSWQYSHKDVKSEGGFVMVWDFLNLFIWKIGF